ncbi:hypothetical protein CHARACLAT_018469 [Characodon lateralis]|uniref:Uncharacterized protein n=1 Tax=Characodon lateralis TaxID=208331 RepID=A0ABU7DSC8_9TELE|nr:hypothetical protein [Characodon lateralis]
MKTKIQLFVRKHFQKTPPVTNTLGGTQPRSGQQHETSVTSQPQSTTQTPGGQQKEHEQLGNKQLPSEERFHPDEQTA